MINERMYGIFFFHFPQIKSVPKELRDVQEDFGKGLD